MFAQSVEPFVAERTQALHAVATLRRCRKMSSLFCAYLAGGSIPVEKIDQTVIEKFLTVAAQLIASRPGAPSLRPEQRYQRQALYAFWRFLRGRGIKIPFEPDARSALRLPAEHENALSEDQGFLRNHRGLAPGTIRRYVEHAVQLCRHLSATRKTKWNRLTPRVLHTHLRNEAQANAPGTMNSLQTALRSFLPFLKTTGRISGPVERFFVWTRKYRYQTVPRSARIEDVRKLFQATERSDPSSILDRATLMLLTVYGLRIREVASLTLDDIRWEHGRLILRCRKGGRDLHLPLFPGVAQAMYRYLSEVRPRNVPYREVFVTHVRPRPYLWTKQLRARLAWRGRKIGVRVNAHSLRHMLARELINNSCPPAWIQILLGHKNIESTMIYAKVDLAHLREVAESDALPL